VTNFGVSGTTMLKAPAASYWKTSALTEALAAEPQIAIFWFGGNDAKPENWGAHKGEFLGDYEAMVRQFQALPSHPRTFAILSLMTRDTEGIPKAVVDGEVIPLVRQAAAGAPPRAATPMNDGERASRRAACFAGLLVAGACGASGVGAGDHTGPDAGGEGPDGGSASSDRAPDVGASCLPQEISDPYFM